MTLQACCPCWHSQVSFFVHFYNGKEKIPAGCQTLSCPIRCAYLSIGDHFNQFTCLSCLRDGTKAQNSFVCDTVLSHDSPQRLDIALVFLNIHIRITVLENVSASLSKGTTNGGSAFLNLLYSCIIKCLMCCSILESEISHLEDIRAGKQNFGLFFARTHKNVLHSCTFSGRIQIMCNLLRSPCEHGIYVFDGLQNDFAVQMLDQGKMKLAFERRLPHTCRLPRHTYKFFSNL